MKKNVSLLFCLTLIGFLALSCVKDTNFDDLDDVALTPVFDIDLVYFDQEASDYFDPTTANGMVTLTDTTEIRFLNEGDLGENIKRVEFYFKFTNSIPRNFQANFEFLNKNNALRYETQTTVAPGSPNVPVVTEFIENVEGDDILELTKAEKVVVLLTIDSSDQNLTGNLNLQSKATYYLEF